MQTKIDTCWNKKSSRKNWEREQLLQCVYSEKFVFTKKWEKLKEWLGLGIILSPINARCILECICSSYVVSFRLLRLLSSLGCFTFDRLNHMAKEGCWILFYPKKWKEIFLSVSRHDTHMCYNNFLFVKLWDIWLSFQGRYLLHTEKAIQAWNVTLKNFPNWPTSV